MVGIGNLAASYGPFVAMVLAAIGVLQFALKPLGTRIDALGQNLESLNTAVVAKHQQVGREQAALRQQIGLLILAISGVLPHLHTKEGEEANRGFEQFRVALVQILVPAVEMERGMGNPLTPQELNRLACYQDVLMTRLLTPAEARDFEQLTAKMAESHPDEPNLGAIAAIAGIVVGLALLFAAATGEMP